jgi:Ca2+-binding EF-hand superfamily protein
VERPVHPPDEREVRVPRDAEDSEEKEEIRMMTLTNWIKGFAAMGLGLLTASAALAQQPTPPAAPTNGQQPTPPPSAPANRTTQVGEGIEINRMPGDIPGPIDSLHDIQDTLKMAFMAADQNHDGLVSQDEATDAGNLLVGGLFFAADTNGDGTLSKDEAQAARQKILRQNPLLKFALQRAKNPNQTDLAGTEAVKNVGDLLDANNDQQLQASEIRNAVKTGVQGIFALADTNRDGQLSPTEMNSAVYAMARAGVQAAFQAADGNNDGALSKEEFAQALTEPANAAFDILDADLDGRLTTQELDRAGRVLASQLQAFTIPEAQNSAENLIEQGRVPRELAPQPGAAPAPATPRTPRR